MQELMERAEQRKQTKNQMLVADGTDTRHQ